MQFMVLQSYLTCKKSLAKTRANCEELCVEKSVTLRFAWNNLQHLPNEHPPRVILAVLHGAEMCSSGDPWHSPPPKGSHFPVPCCEVAAVQGSRMSPIASRCRSLP